MTSNQQVALSAGDLLTAAWYNGLRDDAIWLDGVCGQASDTGAFTTPQSMDDELDSGPYIAAIRQGSYGALTISTNDVTILLGDGVDIGKITLSGNNITIVGLSGSSLIDAIHVSGSNCAVISLGRMYITTGGADTQHLFDVTGADFRMWGKILIQGDSGGGTSWNAIDIDTGGTGALIGEGVLISESDNNAIQIHEADAIVHGARIDAVDLSAVALEASGGVRAIVGASHMANDVGSGDDDSVFHGNFINNASPVIFGTLANDNVVVANRMGGTATDLGSGNTITGNVTAAI